MRTERQLMVDEFIRSTDIAEALLRAYNRGKNWKQRRMMKDAFFIAYQPKTGVERYAHVAIVFEANGVSPAGRSDCSLGRLYVIMGRELNARESAFFRQLNIGWN